MGDRYVLELMRERGWLYGGENSGHIICLGKHTTGDGIVSALQVLGAMRNESRTLVELTADLVMYPQVLLNVGVPAGFDWRAHPIISQALAEGERALDGRGRVLLRPSGTEPVLRVMVEGEPRADHRVDRAVACRRSAAPWRARRLTFSSLSNARRRTVDASMTRALCERAASRAGNVHPTTVA